MKKFLLIFFSLLQISSIRGWADSNLNIVHEQPKNNWGTFLKQSPFGIGIDVQTKYMWRGMEMMTEESAPVLFPTLNYQWNGLYVYAMGGYAVNGKYAEVDLGVSYSWKGFTFGLNDYYYPTVNSNNDEYFRGGKNTGHWLEAVITYAPDYIPVWATISNFFYGADIYINAAGNIKQAYSTYIEIGSYYDFLESNRISFALGIAPNKSCYNGYEKNLSVCNLDLKYTYNVAFKNGWTLPLNVEYIYNPVNDKAFVNFSFNMAF